MKLDSALLRYGKEFEFVLLDVPVATDAETRRAYFERSDLVLCSIEYDAQPKAKDKAAATLRAVAECRNVRPKLLCRMMVIHHEPATRTASTVSFSGFVHKLAKLGVGPHPKNPDSGIQVYVEPKEIKKLTDPKQVANQPKTDESKADPPAPRRPDIVQDHAKPSSKAGSLVERKRTGKQVKQFTVYLPPKILKEVRKVAIDEDQSVSDSRGQGPPGLP